MQLLPSRPESTDAMPIETVFGDLNTWLRDECCPKNVAEIREGVKLWCEKHLDVAKCRKHVVRKSMEFVEKMDGRSEVGTMTRSKSNLHFSLLFVFTFNCYNR